MKVMHVKEFKFVHLKLATLLGEETLESTKFKGLMVWGINECKEASILATCSREDIPEWKKDQKG